MKIPKPRAKIGDVVVIEVKHDYKQEKITRAETDVFFDIDPGHKWHKTEWHYQSLQHYWRDKDILANLTTGEYFNRRFKQYRKKNMLKQKAKKFAVRSFTGTKKCTKCIYEDLQNGKDSWGSSKPLPCQSCKHKNWPKEDNFVGKFFNVKNIKL